MDTGTEKSRQRRWLLGWAIAAVAYGGLTLVVPLYILSIGGDAFTLGILASAAAFVAIPGSLLSGRYIDRTRRHRELILAALAVGIAMTLLMALSESITVVVIANSVIWMSFAGAAPALTVLVLGESAADTWSRHIGRLSRHQGLGWAAGLLLGTGWSILAIQFADESVVLRLLLVILALFGIAGLVLTATGLPAPNRQMPPRRRIAHLVTNGTFNIRSVTVPVMLVRADFRGLYPRTMIRQFSAKLWLYFGAITLVFGGFSFFFAPLPAFLVDVGFRADRIFILYFASSLTAAMYYQYVGDLSTRVDIRMLQSMALLLRSVLFPLIAVVGWFLGATMFGFSSLLVLFVLVGASWATISVTAGTLVSQLSPANIRGQGLGLYAALGGFAGGIGSIGGGWVARESYLMAFLLAGVLILFGAAIVLYLYIHWE